MRIEPELREAVDRQAENWGVSRSALVRAALIQVVDPDVLEDAARRERLEAFLRGMEADADRLRATLRRERGDEIRSKPKWVAGLSTDSGTSFSQALADELAAYPSQAGAA